MNCDFQQLSLYMEGHLDLSKQRKILDHVKSCPPCRDELAAMRRMDTLIQALGRSRRPVPPATEERILMTVDRKLPLKPFFALSRVTPAAVGSAVAALLVMLSFHGAALSSVTTTPTSAGLVSFERQIPQSLLAIEHHQRMNALSQYHSRRVKYHRIQTTAD